jgi:phage-related holin
MLKTDVMHKNNMELTSKISLFATMKNSSYFLVYIWVTAFLSIEPQASAILLTLMVVDVITGIVRSAVLNGMVSIKSSIGTRGLLAKILTISGILSVALAFKGVGFEPSHAVGGIIAVFILAETYSILGNVHSAITRVPKNEYDAVAFLIGLVRSLLEKYTNTK